MSTQRPARRQSRLAGEHPAYATPVPSPGPDPEHQPSPKSSTPASSPTPAGERSASMPSPRRRKVVRVQLNTRIEHDLHERLTAFVAEHDAAVQDVVETALAEYLDARDQWS